MRADIYKGAWCWYIKFYDRNGEYIPGSIERWCTKEEAVDRALWWKCEQINFI